MEKLAGKVAVITGGAMGNGFGIAKIFLKYKAKVIILDNAKELGTTLGLLEKEFGKDEVIGYEVDIRDKKNA